ncbi:MAG: macrolide 2'-phosphotransferase [Microbacteriaceae bacterium]|nr:macrolide 2'-phosphotransferase [Microbacteriaceae bacterium]
MARSAFTLAALASAAVPGLDVRQAAPLADPDFDAAVLGGADGRDWLVRVPRTKSADRRLESELRALAALTPGARARLPFAVTSLAGRTKAGPTFVAVTERFPGEAVPATAIPVEPEGLGYGIGQAIGAVHLLPPTIVADAALPMSGPAESRRAAIGVLDRTVATGMLPVAVQARWQHAIDDADLWQFQARVVGGFDSSSFLAVEDTVVALEGWHGLAIGDPAEDFKWAVQTERVADAVFSGYWSTAGTGDRRLRHRAALLSELDLGRWLLHGVESKATDVVDDAVELLTNLAERIHGDMSARIDSPTAPVLTVDEVEDLLDRTPSR